MANFVIRGVPVSFPFKPYDIQKDYMEKVIECLQNETNGVLESPTGTGKTLSLLCSSLAWLTLQKAKFQADVRMCGSLFSKNEENESPLNKLLWDVPVIIYASRTHSQLTQAMQELKRTSYAHVRSTIVGSRDQLCIHPEVVQQENNAQKILMCQGMVKTRSCHLYNRVEKMSTEPVVYDTNIVDIEDLVKLGGKHKFCPYYMTRELKKNADIVFLPYNYLLDPKARRANQLDLNNSIVILDEAHNIERTCEESVSFEIKTTEIALCIDEVTEVMKAMESGKNLIMDDAKADFSSEDLMLLKSMLLNLEKAVDVIALPTSNEGITFDGKYIFEIFKQAGIDDNSQSSVLALLDNLIQFLNTVSKENPFQRTGAGLQVLQDLLMIAFQNVSEEFKEKINECFKVHLFEEQERRKGNTADTWLSKASSTKSTYRVLCYWCFSPSFGMKMLLAQGVRSIILTSGTLAPLKPLITELGIKIDVKLENPHVVDQQQVCIKILGTGPDGTPLNSAFQNRENEKYFMSLGLTVLNICRQVPHGLLIFFPSYAVLSKCQEIWQYSNIWSRLNDLKMIFVEPKSKDAFNAMMYDYYERVKNPVYKGAIFIAVCRGKVSEGLDFADINGRAVIIIGLPYPPFKDPKIVLKKKYLDLCRSKDTQYLSGQEWYSLEATRAVNQAIGRVIRHRYDYGAIILLDNRFTNFNIRNHLSLWVRNNIKVADNFGHVIRDMSSFFKNASLLDNKKLTKDTTVSEVSILEKSKAGPSGSEQTEKENDQEKKVGKVTKRRKIVLLKPLAYTNEVSVKYSDKETKEFILLLKSSLDQSSYEKFTLGLTEYKNTNNLDIFLGYLNEIFLSKPHLCYLIQGMLPYIKENHKPKFLNYWEQMR